MLAQIVFGNSKLVLASLLEDAVYHLPNRAGFEFGGSLDLLSAVRIRSSIFLGDDRPTLFAKLLMFHKSMKGFAQALRDSRLLKDVMG